jgi:hypothetical protein
MNFMTFNAFKITVFATFSLVAIGYGQKNPIIEKNSKQKEFAIDWEHWKVTLPVGKPTEIGYPEIMDYANNEELKKWMYNDYADGSVVFYTYPGATTANASYSRCELREQIVPGENTHNWTFAQGGRLKGTLAMAEISKDSNGKYHRAIIMQIHGRLTEAQRRLIGQKDNNAPPVLKIYWDNGKVRVKTKILKDKTVSDKDILYTKAWEDDNGHTFKESVGFNKFTIEVKVSDGRLEVILNSKESVVYNGFDMKKWGVFENYFKAGNYLQTLDANAFAKVKYYSLEVSH